MTTTIEERVESQMPAYRWRLRKMRLADLRCELQGRQNQLKWHPPEFMKPFIERQVEVCEEVIDEKEKWSGRFERGKRRTTLTAAPG